jgi:hypothetical protein
MSVEGMGEIAVCASIVTFSSTSTRPMRLVSEDMTLVRGCTCCQARSSTVVITKEAKTETVVEW